MQLDIEITAEDLQEHLDEAKARVDILGIDEGTVKIIENLAVTEPNLALAMMAVVEGLTLDEVIVKHVDSRGNVERLKDRKTRERNAYQTTGLTKSQRRQIARLLSKQNVLTRQLLLAHNVSARKHCVNVLHWGYKYE